MRGKGLDRRHDGRGMTGRSAGKARRPMRETAAALAAVALPGPAVPAAASAQGAPARDVAATCRQSGKDEG